MATIPSATHCTEADVAAPHLGLARSRGLDSVAVLLMAPMIPPAEILAQAENYAGSESQA